MLTGLYIALFRRSRRRVLATNRVGGFGVALLGLSFLRWGFQGSAVKGQLLDRVEAYSALVGALVILGRWSGRRPVINSEDFRRSSSRIRLPAHPGARALSRLHAAESRSP